MLNPSMFLLDKPINQCTLVLTKALNVVEAFYCEFKAVWTICPRRNRSNFPSSGRFPGWRNGGIGKFSEAENRMSDILQAECINVRIGIRTKI